MAKTDWQGCSEHKIWREGCINCWCPSKAPLTFEPATKEVIQYCDGEGVYVEWLPGVQQWKATASTSERTTNVVITAVGVSLSDCLLSLHFQTMAYKQK